MQINEVVKQIDLSKRAIKYYEEAGLLIVAKDENGYRNYTMSDIKRLKEISAYRKLGISIKDIKVLLSGENNELLEAIYREKVNALEESKGEVEALKTFIADHNVEQFYGSVDYETVGKAIMEMIPGFYGYFFLNHFMPYLQIKIETAQQQEAYENIIAFWDQANIKIPLFMKLSSYLLYKSPKASIEQMASGMEEKLKSCAYTPEEEYEKLKEQTRRNVMIQNKLLFKYHPAFIAKRKFMKNLQDSGYNDIFIPNMAILSPAYRKYHEALTAMNDRICRDLGLYYDSNYRLVLKDKKAQKDK